SFGEQERTTQVHTDHHIPLLNCHFFYRKRVIDGGAINDDVQPTEVLMDCLNGAQDCFSISNIALNGNAFDILRLQITIDALCGGFIDVDTGDQASGGGKGTGGGFSQATACAGGKDY